MDLLSLKVNMLLKSFFRVDNKLQDAEPSPYSNATHGLLSPSVPKSPGPIGMSTTGTLKTPTVSQKALVQDKVIYASHRNLFLIQPIFNLG